MGDQTQGLHRLEKVLEKSLKNKSAFEKYWKITQRLEKSLHSTISEGLSTVDRDLNQYKIVVPLFGAAFAICCTKYRHNNFILIFQYQCLNYFSLAFPK